MELQEANPPEGSLRDFVTGLYSRPHLISRMRENMARLDRSKEKMAVILWDIEGFGAFNNEFGQKHGNELLRKVAETIKKCLRVYDEAFRSGNDEFCALLVPADEKIAMDVMSRVKKVVAEHLFDHGTMYAKHNFQLASGVVFYPSPEKLPEALLYAAGQALYKSRIEKEAK